MADKISPPSSPGSSPMNNPSFTGGFHKPPLTISTSPPEWADNSQSPASGLAQPPSFHNGPLSPPSSPYPTPLRSATTPTSAGHKALRFASIGGGSAAADAGGKARPAESRRKSGSDVTSAGAMKRRSSGEQKNNVHTGCGRHGDEWLFGGWSDAVKKMLWEKDQKNDF